MTPTEAPSQPTTDTPEAAPDAPSGKPSQSRPPASAAPTQETADATPASSGPVDVRNLQDKFNSLLDQRNQFNEAGKKAREDRDHLNEGKRAKFTEIDVHKTARDEANEEMRKHKEVRNAFQDEAKALIASKKGKAGAGDVARSLPLTVRKLRNDLQSLIEQQQTTSLTIAKERVLVEKISELWKELKAKEGELQKQKTVEVDMSEADGSIDALFAKADEAHAEVSKWMKVAQEHHEKMVAGYKEIRVLESESDKRHHEFIACKTKADECHNKAMELREKVMQVRGERKAAFDAERSEIREVNQTARRNVSDPRALERAQDSALDQLKKGGKIKLGY